MRHKMRKALVASAILAGAASGIGFGGAAIAGAATKAALHMASDTTGAHTKVETRTSRLDAAFEKSNTTGTETSSTDTCKHTSSSNSASST